MFIGEAPLSSAPYHRLVVLSIANRPAANRSHSYIATAPQQPHKPRCHCPATLVTTGVLPGLVEAPKLDSGTFLRSAEIEEVFLARLPC